MPRKRNQFGLEKIPRTRWLTYVAALCFIIFIARLFQLQILNYDHYTAQARAKHILGVEIPARRGEIYVRDHHTGELSLLATNISLDLLYVDPVEIEDPVKVVNALTPFIFNSSDYRDELCSRNSNCREAKAEGLAIDILEEIEEMSTHELEEDFKQEFLDKISVREYDHVTLKRDVTPEIAAQISAMRLTGVFVETNEPEEPEKPAITREDVEEEVSEEGEEAEEGSEEVTEEEEIEEDSAEDEEVADEEETTPEEEIEEEEEEEKVILSTVWVNPILISDPISASEKLASLLEMDALDLEQKMTRRQIRYVKLANKIPPEVSSQIRELNLRGVGLIREHWRYYPEGELASQALGFVNHEGYGQYGVEGAFNSELEGKKGIISAETDRMGRLLPTQEAEIREAKDGDTLVLTIDRNIQSYVEEALKQQVDGARADSGQVIIMDPWDGSIIALAEYPSFDPNNYGDVYAKQQLYEEEPPKHTMKVMEENGKQYVYKNELGPVVYRLKTILDIYEPGSTFKSLAMAASMDAGILEPHTPFHDTGPITIDEFTIHNSEDDYHGWITMVDVLKYSLNTGMTFVAQSMGAPLFYEYIVNYGFGERTDIEFEGELEGQLEHYRHWAPTELATKAFGQGIATTPIQMVTAYAVLANGGYLLQPHIIAERIEADGTTHKFEREVVRRVISEETSRTMSAMLVTSVRSGAAKPARVPGYLIAGKTGTSQIAKGGRYEKGEGTTIASFAGYAPADNPKFVMLIKIDRPRATQWGSTNAAPLFAKISGFLFEYYGISPSDGGKGWVTIE